VKKVELTVPKEGEKEEGSEGEEEEKKEEEKKDIYPSLIQKKKNDNITVGNFSEIVLCQIPLVNHTFASVIMKKYNHNLNTLLEALKNDPKCLSDLSYTTSTNKVRKISKNCIENIVKFLCPEEEKSILNR
jgi:hypothetical protein